jgi:acid phosphatase type 7
MKLSNFIVVFGAVAAVFLFGYVWHKPSVPSALYLTWLHDPTSTMTIQWHNKDDPSSVILFQKEGEQEWLRQEGHSKVLPNATLLFGNVFVHTVELVSLASDTNYSFKIGENPTVYRFRTMPKTSGRPLFFVVGGDVYQDDVLKFKKMNREVAHRDPDFVILGGDIAYTRGHGAFLKGRYFEIKRWQTFFKAWQEQMITSDGRLIPLIVVIGNHDLESTHPDPRKKPVLFYEFFAMPEPLISYRTLDFGSYLSLILLDTGHTYPIAGAQTAWLEKTLSEREHIPHKMAVYHVSAYPSVYDYNKGNRRHIRRHWVPLFERYQVRTAFEHHDHAFKRTFRLKEGKIDPEGVLYLGDGGWAVMPRQVRSPLETWYLEKAAAVNFVYLVALQNEKGIVQAIDIRGRIFDEVELLPSVSRAQE